MLWKKKIGISAHLWFLLERQRLPQEKLNVFMWPKLCQTFPSYPLGHTNSQNHLRLSLYKDLCWLPLKGGLGWSVLALVGKETFHQQDLENLDSPYTSQAFFI